MRNSRGEPSERIVEPMTLREDGRGGDAVSVGEELLSVESWTEVTMTCGTE